MPRLTIAYENTETVLTLPTGTLLSAAIAQSQLPFHLPCNQNHTCGKCKVKIADPLPPCEGELPFLSPQELADGIRLACFTPLASDTYLWLEAKAQSKIQLAGYMPSFDLDPVEHDPQRPYGFAVDIGTTTVAAYLYDLRDGSLLATAADHNAQAIFGADVISRIEYCNNNTVHQPAAAIRGQLGQLFESCVAQSGATLRQVGAAVITGNTTMLHLLCALDPHDIAVMPFVAPSLFGQWIDAGQLELPLPEDCPVFLPRCANAYVGADITCAALSCGLNPDETALLVDVGTNGEMVLACNSTLKGCATAAGPAFEGAGLHQGMSAVPGAIDTVEIKDGALAYTTVKNAPAKGICGSGIIDAVAALKNLEIVDETGYLETDGAGYCLADSDVMVTQGDIRQIQLAKSAVASGIETLLHEYGISADEVDHFYLAGGFGSYIRMESAVTIGLFPAPLAAKAVVLGNAAGSGAALILLSKAMLERSQTLAAEIEDVSLAQSPYFMNAYTENMMF